MSEQQQQTDMMQSLLGDLECIIQKIILEGTLTSNEIVILCGATGVQLGTVLKQIKEGNMNHD